MDYLLGMFIFGVMFALGYKVGYEVRQLQLNRVRGKILTDLEDLFKYVKELEQKVKDMEAKQ